MTPPHGLGRIHNPDPRNAAYSMASVVGTTLVLKERVWAPGPILDQGQTPHCVGYAGAQYLQVGGHALVHGKDDGDALYYACKAVDGEPKAEDGSTDNSLMKVLTKLRLVGSYHWAASEQEIATWLSTTGPILFGTPWLQGMFTPDATGRVPLKGAVAGGHEYVGIGIHPGKTLASSLVECVNSWGAGWAKGGHFFMSIGDAWKLIAKGGDACAATEVA